MCLPLFSGFVWSAVIWKTTFPYFFPTVTHQSTLEFTQLMHVDSQCAGHLIVLFTEPDLFMAARPVSYFHMNIHPLRWYGKILLMQTNLKTFISLTSTVLSPFCINSAHGKVLVPSILTCPNYSMQFLVSQELSWEIWALWFKVKRGLRIRGFGVCHGEYTSCICGRKCSQYRSHFFPWFTVSVSSIFCPIHNWLLW